MFQPYSPEKTFRINVMFLGWGVANHQTLFQSQANERSADANTSHTSYVMSVYKSIRRDLCYHNFSISVSFATCSFCSPVQFVLPKRCTPTKRFSYNHLQPLIFLSEISERSEFDCRLVELTVGPYVDAIRILIGRSYKTKQPVDYRQQWFSLMVGLCSITWEVTLRLPWPRLHFQHGSACQQLKCEASFSRSCTASINVSYHFVK